jgi:hypothetical protein
VAGLRLDEEGESGPHASQRAAYSMWNMMPAATDAPSTAPALAASERRVPAFIPCHRKDLPTLPFCIEALRRHPQITTIHVICDSSMKPDCVRLEVEHIDELSLLKHWFPTDEPYGDKHWYYQMFLKLSVAFATDFGVDRYLIIDADTVLLHSFPLIDDAGGAILHPKMTEHHIPYYTGMRELLGREVLYEGSYIAHFMVYRAPIIREMFAEFARIRNRPPREGAQVLREFLETCDRHTRSFADYESYGYFARERFPEELAWTNRRHLNLLYVKPSERVLRLLRPGYDFCSFHAYLRPDSLPHRVAGAAWLGLRLLRDRLAAFCRLRSPSPEQPG